MFMFVSAICSSTRISARAETYARLAQFYHRAHHLNLVSFQETQLIAKMIMKVIQYRFVYFEIISITPHT